MEDQIKHEKVFCLGVGAQKAGTSWLHDQLNKRSDTNFGFLKEYHVFDALTLDEFKRFRPGVISPLKWRTWRRRRMIANPRRYFDYFASLLKRRDIRLTGDITPSYACLHAQTIQWINSEFERRGITTRVVFLMRDPVERILSQHRMKLRTSGNLEPDKEVEQLRSAANKLVHRQSHRSDYLSTLNVLNHAIDQQNVFIDLYERLFTEPVFSRLCQHLNIAYTPPNWGERVNQSRSTTAIPPDILELIGASQRTTFQTLITNYPQLDLETHWPTASRWCG